MKTTEEILQSRELQLAVDEFCESNDLYGRNGVHDMDSETNHDRIDCFTLGYVAAAKDAERSPVSIHYGEDNTPDGVLVQTLDEKFVVELHDLDGKSDFNFNTANVLLKVLGKTTFNRRQALVLLTYIEEVNAALVEAGGEPIAKDWYTTSELYKPVGCADYDADHSWCFHGNYGGFDYTYRCIGIFRCRPVLGTPAAESD